MTAYLTQKQRLATRSEVKIAGFYILRVFNEPATGAFAYELAHAQDGLRNILIYDFGCGPFDVTILEVQEKALRVKAANGSAYLGSEGIDVAIQDHFLDEIRIKLRSET